MRDRRIVQAAVADQCAEPEGGAVLVDEIEDVALGLLPEVDRERVRRREIRAGENKKGRETKHGWLPESGAGVPC